MGHYMRSSKVAPNPGILGLQPEASAAISSAAATNQQQQTMCHCYTFLHPYSAGMSNYGNLPTCMQHYCRVCNIRLNSCRQAKIHSDGKKHIKRLNYLQMSMESAVKAELNFTPPEHTTSTTTTTSGINPFTHDPTPAVNTVAVSNFQSCPPPQVQYSNCPSTGFLYHPISAPPPSGTVPPPAPPPPIPSIAQGPPPPATNVQTSGQPLPPSGGNTFLPVTQPFLANPSYPLTYQSFQDLYNPPVMPTNTFTTYLTPPPPVANSMIDMSHSLTSSGFSGSGPDCSKSTETGSILSTASHSSSCQPPPNYHLRNYYHNNVHNHNLVNNNYINNNNNSNTLPRAKENTYKTANKYRQTNNNHTFVCNNCHHNGLDSHYKLNRKVRDHHLHHHEVYKQHHHHHGNLNGVAGASRSNSKSKLLIDKAGEIKCEVCQVSVNSSHQLEAHLAGHKHRVRAVRRGLKPDQVLASPSSSTLTSASESDHGVHQHHSGLRRRSSDFNLMRASQGIVGPTGTTRQRCYTASGGAQNPAACLSRHRSSGCLSSGAWFAKSTHSLRKAISHTGLNKKSRSMNLLMMMEDGDNVDEEEKEDYEAEEDDKTSEEDEVVNNKEDVDPQGVWSSGEAAGEEDLTSSEDQEDVDQVKLDTNGSNGVDDNKNGQPNQNQNQKLTTKTSVTSPAVQNKTVYPGYYNKKEKKIPNSKTCDGKKGVKSKKQTSSSSILSWKQQHHSTSSLLPKHGVAVRNGTSAPGNDNNNNSTTNLQCGGNQSLKEIPMLNVFLQRLNQHSFRRSNGKTLAENDCSSPEH